MDIVANIRNRWRWQRGNKIGFKVASKALEIELTPYLENRGVTGVLIIEPTQVADFLRQSQEAIREFAAQLHAEAEKAKKDTPK